MSLCHKCINEMELQQGKFSHYASCPSCEQPNNLYDIIQEDNMYKGYELYVHPEWKEFNSRICFIKQAGLTLHKVTGFTEDVAISKAKRWIDYHLESFKVQSY